MTKKHFIKLANYIRGHGSFEPFTPHQLDTLADFCATQNPRFDRQLWLDYIAGDCGPSGGKVK